MQARRDKKSYEHLAPHIQWQLRARLAIIFAGCVTVVVGLVWLLSELVGR